MGVVGREESSLGYCAMAGGGGGDEGVGGMGKEMGWSVFGGLAEA